MRLLILLALPLLLACDPRDGGFGPGGPGDTGFEPGPDGDCVLVTLGFRAELVTIAGTPFGLSYETDAGRMASGSMTYDTCVDDTDSFGSPDSGVYDHVQWERGASSFTLEEGGPALAIQGSSRPLVGIRGLDYFDFEDGGYDVFEELPRSMTVNGVLDEEAELGFTIGGGEVDFDTDALPELFPMQGQSEDDFACMGGAYCVTFSVAESTFGDSFLMTLHELSQLED